jgi:hypothetical protein
MACRQLSLRRFVVDWELRRFQDHYGSVRPNLSSESRQVPRPSKKLHTKELCSPEGTIRMPPLSTTQRIELRGLPGEGQKMHVLFQTKGQHRSSVGITTPGFYRVDSYSPDRM